MAEIDDWSTEGPNFVAPERLATIERILEQAPIILEHWHYRSSRAPDRLVFDDYEALLEYLRTSARPGDRLLAWNYTELCRDDNHVASGKMPDAAGRTPRRGAY